jgi:hypothetical protein
MKARVIRQFANRFQPNRLMSNLFALDLEIDRRGHVSHVKGAGLGPVLCNRVGALTNQIGRRGQRPRAWDVRRKNILVVQARIEGLEGGNHRENRLSTLKSLNASGAKRATIAKSVNRKGDWQVDVSRTKEVTVQRVSGPVTINGALGCHQALCQHLATKDSTVRHPLRWARKNVFGGSRPTRIGQTECI